MLLADFNEDQVEKLLTLLDLVPLNKGREDEKGFIARRMCMRDDCTPIEDHGFIKVAMERTIPKLRDDNEKNFSKIQLAVSLLNHSKNQSDNFAKENRVKALNLLHEAGVKMRKYKDSPKEILIHLNLARAYSQTGMIDEAEILLEEAASKFNKEVDDFLSLITMIHDNSSIPGAKGRDLQGLEYDLLTQYTGEMTALFLSIILEGRYSWNSEFSSKVLEQAKVMCKSVMVENITKDILYHQATGFAFVHMDDQPVQVFREIESKLSVSGGENARKELEEMFTDNVGKAYSFSPKPELIDLWKEP